MPWGPARTGDLVFIANRVGLLEIDENQIRIETNGDAPLPLHAPNAGGIFTHCLDEALEGKMPVMNSVEHE